VPLSQSRIDPSHRNLIQDLITISLFVTRTHERTEAIDRRTLSSFNQNGNFAHSMSHYNRDTFIFDVFYLTVGAYVAVFD